MLTNQHLELMSQNHEEPTSRFPSDIRLFYVDGGNDSAETENNRDVGVRRKRLKVQPLSSKNKSLKSHHFSSRLQTSTLLLMICRAVMRELLRLHGLVLPSNTDTASLSSLLLWDKSTAHSRTINLRPPAAGGTQSWFPRDAGIDGTFRKVLEADDTVMESGEKKVKEVEGDNMQSTGRFLKRLQIKQEAVDQR